MVELEYSNRNSRRSKVYIAVGTIVALLVAATVYVALQASGLTDSEDMAVREVVVAAAPIEPRQPITADQVTTRSVVADTTNAGAFASVDDVVGRVSSVPVAEGQLMTANLLASTTPGQTFSILEPGTTFDPNGADLRAISVTVPDASAVAGTLVPGQLVDLIATMPINPVIEPQSEELDVPVADHLAGPSTKVTLQAMTILARTGDVYILRSDVETAEKLVELTAAGGTFTMVLRPEEDDRTAETEGSTIDRLIEEYDFPVPRPPQFEDSTAAEN